MADRSSWKTIYQGADPPWGLKPDRTLAEYSNLVPKGTVLDLGIGDGRNGFFFARSGYEVEGFDISQTAVLRCLEQAKAAKLKVKAEVKDLRRADITINGYSLIIAAWVLNFFKKGEADVIIQKMRHGVQKDGVVYIVVFSPEDPGYKRARENLKSVEKNTFYSPKMESYIHYFTKEEIVTPFSNFEVLYCAEGLGLDLSHGEPHDHGFIEFLGQRR
jgi:cyclopropane fatty-acyl-phospholipid synthase-like methyltransferase